MTEARRALSIAFLIGLLTTAMPQIVQAQGLMNEAAGTDYFVEMLPGVFVHYDWWNESSTEIAQPSVRGLNDSTTSQFIYRVVTVNGSEYTILEDARTSYELDWAFTTLVVTVLVDHDRSLISDLANQNGGTIDIWSIYWNSSLEGFSGDEAILNSGFYCTEFFYIYSSWANYTWSNSNNQTVNPLEVVPQLLPDYNWAYSMIGVVEREDTAGYSGFGFDVNEMIRHDNGSQWMQHYFSGISAFNDSNSNGVLDLRYDEIQFDLDGDGVADWSDYLINSTASEERYSFYADTLSLDEVTTPFINSLSQIEWGVRVVSIEGHLLGADPIVTDFKPGAVERPTPAVVLSTVIDSFECTYRFKEDADAAILKIDQHVGDFRETVSGEIPQELEGLSLSLDYWSSFSQSDLQVISGGDVLDYSNAYSAEAVPDGEVSITHENTDLIDIQFGGTYVWGKDGLTYPVNSSMVPTFVGKSYEIGVTSTASGRGSWSSGSYYYSSCYPNWGGYSIVHDPIFIGYTSSSTGGRLVGAEYVLLFGGFAIMGVFAFRRVRKNRSS